MSKLQEYTAKRIYELAPHINVIENFRPYWLNGNGSGTLELDFYFPDIKAAIEIQGRQHYTYISYFHKNYDGFLSQVKRDELKKSICLIEGIRLFEASTEQEVDKVLIDILGKDEMSMELRLWYQKREVFVFKKVKPSLSQYIANPESKGKLKILVDVMERSLIEFEKIIPKP